MNWSAEEVGGLLLLVPEAERRVAVQEQLVRDLNRSLKLLSERKRGGEKVYVGSPGEVLFLHPNPSALQAEKQAELKEAKKELAAARTHLDGLVRKHLQKRKGNRV